MRKLIFIGILLPFFSSCTSPQERAAIIANADNDACVSYGAQPGTQEYFQCRMAKDQQRQANNAALASAILNRPMPQPYVLPMPQH